VQEEDRRAYYKKSATRVCGERTRTRTSTTQSCQSLQTRMETIKHGTLSRRQHGITRLPHLVCTVTLTAHQHSLPSEAPNLTKPRQKHQRTQSYKSNPDSDQQDQHIAYLESELATYQTQLASLNSPSVTKEKGQKIRQLNQDIRRLEQENSRWEAEFDERVLQVMEEHDGVENNLRARINMLEADSDKYSTPRERLWTLPKLQMSSLRRGWRRLHICLLLRLSRPKRRFLNLPSPRNLGVRGRRGCLSTAFPLLALCIKRVCLNTTKEKSQDHTARVLYKTTSTTPSATQSGRPPSESLSSATPHATASISASS
jgi:hypothetical protein